MNSGRNLEKIYGLVVRHFYSLLSVARVFCFGDRQKKSVLFFTLHKCASSLFAGYALKTDRHRVHIDYARKIYKGRNPAVSFREVGRVYGPIRVSSPEGGPVYEHLVEPFSKSEFLADKTVAIFVRDPRDILVSSYFSFGFTHGLSNVPSIAAREVATKSKIQSMSIDEYAIQEVGQMKRNFEKLVSISKRAEVFTILRYEDMVKNWDEFSRDYKQVLDISDTDLQKIHRKSRPRVRESAGSHKRSGKVEGFRSKLRPETIESINTVIESELRFFGYEL